MRPHGQWLQGRKPTAITGLFVILWYLVGALLPLMGSDSIFNFLFHETVSGEMWKKILLNSDSEPMISQILQTPPKSSFGNQWVSLWLLTGIWVKSLLLLQKYLKGSCITKAHLSTGGSAQTYSTRSSLQAAQQVGRVLSRCLSWPESLPDNSAFWACPKHSILLMCSWGKVGLGIWSVWGNFWHHFELFTSWV